jgi:hypothetical protein
MMNQRIQVEREKQKLLDELMVERYGELATRPEGSIPDDDDN